MNVLRSYTVKILLAVFIWMGIGVYLVRPVQAETPSNSFASWLKTVVKKGDNSKLRQKIYQLEESEDTLDSLIQKASEIVSRHNDAFNLPISDKTSDSEQVYNLLIVEWNFYQTGNGMGKAMMPTTVKSNLIPTVDKFGHCFGIQADKAFQPVAYTSIDESNSIDPPSFSYKIIPLSGGIAIGAP